MKLRQKTTAMLAACIMTAMASGAAEISRMTIDGGGTLRSTGGTFELSGTIGQPDAGVLSGGTFTISGGFWHPTPPGDVNEDGSTSLADLAAFPACMGGPGGLPPATPCLPFDVNRSGSVDLIDFAAIQQVFAKP